MKMWTDPVVEEIHQIRQKMLAEVNGDLNALMAKFYAHQNSQPGDLIGERLPALTAESESKENPKGEALK
jgi:hypothetical protein